VPISVGIPKAVQDTVTGIPDKDVEALDRECAKGDVAGVIIWCNGLDETWAKQVVETAHKHGTLVIFDEVVTGVGRTGRWFAGEATPCPPDIIAAAKGLGAGYAAIGAVLVRDHVYEAVARGSRRFTLGHTWDGAPLPCAVGLSVLEALRSEGLIQRVAERGKTLREELEVALRDIPMVKEVRGQGFLLGVSFADPRDGRSFLPPALRVAGRLEEVAFRRGLITLSTQPTRDGYAGDQTLFAPPFTTPDDDIAVMVERFAQAVREVAAEVDPELEATALESAG
jgi:adenosylmethionine-8-amino-7-oxononanoate aminotransferase